MLPTPEFARNLRLVGFSDQGGRPDGVQLMVVDGFAYVAHMFSRGFSVIDVRDPAHPKPGAYIPCPANTWSLHLQAAEDLLLVRVHDIGDPFRPVETAAFVPAATARLKDDRPGVPQISAAGDVFVDAQGLLYATDQNGGLSTLERT